MVDNTLGTDLLMHGDHSWAEDTTILRCEVGSGLHGIAEGTPNDRDEMGVCIEPYQAACGLRAPFEQHIYRTAAVREGRHDAPSKPGDLDLTLYSLRKWTRLALNGNPSVLLLLFAPSSHMVKIDALGTQLQQLAPAFISKQCGKAFLGYMQAQRQRLEGTRGQKNVNRHDLVEKYGFDTKYAAHVLRLGIQGVELLSTGCLTLPMCTQRYHIIDVRQGKVGLSEVLQEAGELERQLKDLLDTSWLPTQPDTAKVERWMIDVYWHTWAATFGHASSLRGRSE